MFCQNCGSQLKDGARFCARCGAPAAVAGYSSGAGADVGAPWTGTPAAGAAAPTAPNGASRAGEARTAYVRTPTPVRGAQGAGGSFDGAVRAGRRRGRKKMSPIMVVALVLALMAGTAIAAHYVYQSSIAPEETVEAQLEMPEPVALAQMSSEEAGQTLGNLIEVDIDGSAFYTESESLAEAIASEEEDGTFLTAEELYAALETSGGSLICALDDSDHNVDADTVSSGVAVKFVRDQVVDSVPDADGLEGIVGDLGAEHMLIDSSGTIAHAWLDSEWQNSAYEAIDGEVSAVYSVGDGAYVATTVFYRDLGRFLREDAAGSEVVMSSDSSTNGFYDITIEFENAGSEDSGKALRGLRLSWKESIKDGNVYYK